MQKIVLRFWERDRYDADPMKGGAMSKAPGDINQIAVDCNYLDMPFACVKSKYKIVRHLGFFIELFKLWKKIRNIQDQDILIIYSYRHFIVQYQLYIMLIALRKYKNIALIHDIESTRHFSSLSKFENKVLSRYNCIICHSSNMINYLSTHLNNKAILYYDLKCFPYLGKTDNMPRHINDGICFAGNLKKSDFLQDFIAANKTLSINFYGSIDNPSDVTTHQSQYLGKFAPNNYYGLKGAWGLVWDGKSIDTCSGTMGEYLKLNASHKFSMFVNCGMPIIIWKQAALAQLVKDKNIGICVDNIRDLSTQLSTISEDEYNKKLNNIRQFSKEYVSQGQILKQILKDIDCKHKEGKL